MHGAARRDRRCGSAADFALLDAAAPELAIHNPNKAHRLTGLTRSSPRGSAKCGHSQWGDLEPTAPRGVRQVMPPTRRGAFAPLE